MTDPKARLAAALSDRYTLGDEVGVGGMATVYMAQDIKHGRSVALKVLKPELSAAMGTDPFPREIRLVASFNHPHILSLYDSGETDGFLYYVMPFVDGETLGARLAREKELPIGDTIRILIEVTDALAYAHARGVVHRDIKPGNVLLADRHAVVADFGVAKALSTAGGDQLTTVGIAVGTPQYMAPEQAMGEADIDHRVDIYAVGVLLYYSFTGKAPFHGPTPMGTMTAHVIESVPTFAVIIPDIHISPKLETVVQRCLAKLPEDRYPDMAALMADLIACFEEDTGFAYGPSLANIKSIIAARELPPPQARRLPRSLLIGGLLMAGVSIGIGVGLWNSGRLSEAEVAMPAGVPALQPTSSAALDPPASGSPGGTTGAGKVFDVASPSGASGAENRSNGVAEKGAGAEPIPAASPSAVAADVNPAEASSPTTPTVREIQETVRVTTNSLAIKLEPTSRDSAPVAMTTMKASPKVSRPASNAPTTRTSATVRSEKSTRTAPVQASSASEDVVREEGRATADRSAPADEPAAATHDRTGAATPGPATTSGTCVASSHSVPFDQWFFSPKW